MSRPPKQDSQEASTSPPTLWQGLLITPLGSVYSVSASAEGSTRFSRGREMRQALEAAGFTLSDIHTEPGCGDSVVWILRDSLKRARGPIRIPPPAMPTA
jgi:hypothetical protein